MRQREQAICLRTSDFSETSQVVRFLTRSSGALRLLAKGTKRPKSKSGGAIDLLAEGELVLVPPRGDALGTLVEFTETATRRAIRSDASRLNAALYMIELAGELLADADPHPEAFDLLHNALARLEQPDARAPAVLAYFQWRLLRLAGLLGELQQCASCGQQLPSGPVYFSSRQGGLLCDRCEGLSIEKFRLSPDGRKALAVLHAARPGSRATLTEPQSAAANELLTYHVQQQLGKKLKMARHILSANRPK
jgi:DNA repair protein RecO (recombination protein O)